MGRWSCRGLLEEQRSPWKGPAEAHLCRLLACPPQPERLTGPLETGLVSNVLIDKPAVKRLAFNLGTSRVNAALGRLEFLFPRFQSVVPRTLSPVFLAPAKGRNSKGAHETPEEQRTLTLFPARGDKSATRRAKIIFLREPFHGAVNRLVAPEWLPRRKTSPTAG